MDCLSVMEDIQTMEKTEQLIKSFAARIRRLRESNGISQEAFAEAAGIDRAGYGRIERGQVDVRLSTIARIAEALGVPTQVLFEETERPRRRAPGARKQTKK